MEFAVAPATTRRLSLDHFGASGPYARLAEEFGFTPENCLRLARELKCYNIRKSAPGPGRRRAR
jgi:transketolase